MSDQWYYRIYGQDFGPVSLHLVRSLVASGTIAPDDEVRDATWSNWILACAATELRDSIKPERCAPLVERRAVRDEWYCRSAAGDFGPLKLTDLIQLAAQGQLAPDEEIKAKADDYWKQVASFQRLIDLLPFPEKVQRGNFVGAIFPPYTDQPSTIQRDRKNALMKLQHLNKGGPEMAPRDDEEPNIIRFPGAEICQTTAESNSSLSVQPGANESLVSYGQLPNDQSAAADADSRTSDLLQTSTIGNLSPNDGPGIIKMPVRQDTVKNSDSQWTGWIGGKEFGPVGYSQLLTWAVTGELSPTDFIRLGTKGQYVPAVTIPCLFTVRAADLSLSPRTSNSVCTSSPLAATPNGTPAVDPITNSNLVLKEQRRPASSAPQHSNSILREMAADPTSIGVSALLTIALIVVGWIACH